MRRGHLCLPGCAKSCVYLQSVCSESCANTSTNLLWMLQQVSTSLACQHSFPHHSHPALGPWVWVMDRSLSTSVGLFTSLGCKCIPALGNGYQTTQNNPNIPSPPEPKRSSAEQEAFSRCKCECLKLFGLFPFYQTMHPQGFPWDLLLQLSKINTVTTRAADQWKKLSTYTN